MRTFLLLCLAATACGHKAPAPATPLANSVKTDDKKSADHASKGADKDRDGKVDEAAQDGDRYDIYSGLSKTDHDGDDGHDADGHAIKK
jgi:hypothetical protein